LHVVIAVDVWEIDQVATTAAEPVAPSALLGDIAAAFAAAVAAEERAPNVDTKTMRGMKANLVKLDRVSVAAMNSLLLKIFHRPLSDLQPVER